MAQSLAVPTSVAMSGRVVRLVPGKQKGKILVYLRDYS